MKILCCADIHITDQKPKFRTSKYTNQLFNKLDWILKVAKEENCSVIANAGDLFDTSNISYSLYTRTVRTFKKGTVDFLTIAGQHDLRWHTTPLEDTPLGALEASGFVIVPDETTVYKRNVHFYNMGWGQEAPKSINQENVNILLIHTMVTKAGPLFEGQEVTAYTTGKALLKRYKEFDFIISGDNHETHTTTVNGRININPGSLMRKRKDQIDHQPCIYILDTVKGKAKQIFIPVEPVEDVFELEKIETELEKKETEKANISKFTDALTSTLAAPKFIDTLQNIITVNKIKKNTKTLLDNKIEEAKKEIEST